MALTAYIAATNRLLQNPVPASNPLYSTADLTVYINEGRQQLASDAACIRATSSATLTPFAITYAFSLFTSFGYDGTASGTIFFGANPSNLDTITLNGVLWTFVTGSPAANQTQIQGTCAATISVLKNQLNVSANGFLNVAAYAFSGGPSTGTLTIAYKTVGTAGNTYTLAASAATVSGPTLSGGTTTLSGIQGVLTIRQMAVFVDAQSAYKLMTSRPWPWFNRFFLSQGTAQVAAYPNTWSQQGMGTYGTFGIGPPPANAYLIQADCVLLPTNLVDDTTVEAIPYPFTDAIPYYAAYKAYLSSQRTQDATVMFQRYEQFVQRGVQMTAPAVFPMNYPGGLGAQMVASKQSLTMQAQKGGG